MVCQKAFGSLVVDDKMMDAVAEEVEITTSCALKDLYVKVQLSSGILFN